jgi:peptidylprolyl isomerase
VQQAPHRDPAEVLAEKLAAATEMKLEGNALFKSKAFDDAVAKYSAALACLGEVNEDVEMDSDDEDEFEFDGHPEVRALQISLYLNLSMSYMKQNRWSETISSCDVVLKGDNSNAKALYRRGVSFARKKGWQSAKKDLVAAFKIDPNNKEIRKELAEVKRVLLEEKEKRKDSMSKGFGAIYDDKEKEEKERKRKEAKKLEQQRQRFEAENKKRENLG